jgi:hypothetical protein
MAKGYFLIAEPREQASLRRRTSLHSIAKVLTVVCDARLKRVMTEDPGEFGSVEMERWTESRELSGEFASKRACAGSSI